MPVFSHHVSNKSSDRQENYNIVLLNSLNDSVPLRFKNYVLVFFFAFLFCISSFIGFFVKRFIFSLSVFRIILKHGYLII